MRMFGGRSRQRTWIGTRLSRLFMREGLRMGIFSGCKSSTVLRRGPQVRGESMMVRGVKAGNHSHEDGVTEETERFEEEGNLVVKGDISPRQTTTCQSSSSTITTTPLRHRAFAPASTSHLNPTDLQPRRNPERRLQLPRPTFLRQPRKNSHHLRSR